MASDSISTPPYATSPFDHPDADLILRSCDAVDFRVSSYILEIASDFFATMFSAGQAPNEELRDGCPVVPVQEDSTTLYDLLRILYPRDDPVLDDLPRLRTVLAAGLKYDMEKAIEVAGMALQSFVPKEPLRVWAIAVRHRLEVEARAAAEEITRQSISVLDSFPHEMHEICAGAYYRLLHYQRQGGHVEQGFLFCDPPLACPVGSSSVPSISASDQSIISPSHRRIQPFADLICLSRDGQEFPVHKAVLALASPVMSALALPVAAHPAMADAETVRQIPLVTANNLPVLSLEEDGATLKIILGLCYPFSDEDIVVQDLQVLQNVIDAVKKYGMDDAKKFVEGRWALMSASDPFRAFLLASRRQADAESRRAVRQLLDRKMENYYTPSLEITLASQYRALVQYHQLCKSALGDVARELRQSTGGDQSFLPVKSVACRGWVPQPYTSSYATCSGIHDLSLVLRGCEPCLQLAENISNALGRLESQPDALMTALELHGGASQDPFNLQFSRSGDYEKLVSFYNALRTRASDVICKTYSEHMVAVI